MYDICQSRAGTADCTDREFVEFLMELLVGEILCVRSLLPRNSSEMCGTYQDLLGEMRFLLGDPLGEFSSVVAQWFLKRQFKNKRL
jgi:hypothetical protein